MRAKLTYTRVFERMNEGNYVEYRIPGLVVTELGTLIACYEGRMSTHDDWAKIKTVVKRSADDGETWTETVFSIPADMGGSDEDTVNNPTLIADGDRVHMILHQNYARAFYTVSMDEGLTWAPLREITDAFRGFDAPWNVCATGPGHGVVLPSGRLVVPIWIAQGERLDERRYAHQPSRAGALYSDDRGETWRAGALVEGVFDANETTLAALPDGRLLYNIRNREQDFHRRLAISADGGETIARVWRADDLPDPMCFGSMAVCADGSVLFAHCRAGNAVYPEEPRARVDMTIERSADGGETWTPLFHVDDQGGYPDIAVHGDSVYILYEIDPKELGCVVQLVVKKLTLQP